MRLPLFQVLRLRFAAVYLPIDLCFDLSMFYCLLATAAALHDQLSRKNQYFFAILLTLTKWAAEATVGRQVKKRVALNKTKKSNFELYLFCWFNWKLINNNIHINNKGTGNKIFGIISIFTRILSRSIARLFITGCAIKRLAMKWLVWNGSANKMYEWQ